MPRILLDLHAKYHKDVGQLGVRGTCINMYVTNSALLLTSNTQLWDLN